MIKLDQELEKWRLSFQSFKSFINQQCPSFIEEVVHIGSTAVPELPAKDIVDVQLGVHNFDVLPDIKQVLCPIGFKHIESFKQDHVPFKSHSYFSKAWEKRFLTGMFRGQEFNVHIRVIHAPNWNYAIDFKNYLIKSAQARKAYQQLKERLVHAKVNREDYTLIKDPFCDLIYLLFEQAKDHEQTRKS